MSIYEVTTPYARVKNEGVGKISCTNMYRSILPNARNLITKSPVIPSRTPSPTPNAIHETSRMLHSSNLAPHHSGAQLNQCFASEGSEGFVKGLDFSNDVVNKSSDKVNAYMEQTEKMHYDSDGRPHPDIHSLRPYGHVLDQPCDRSHKLKQD